MTTTKPEVVEHMVDNFYRRAITRASRCSNIEEAKEILCGVLQGNNNSFSPELLPQPAARSHQKLLSGILLRAGYFEDASRVLADGFTAERCDSVDALIVDPGFVHLEGHHYNSNVFYKRLLEKCSFSVSLLRFITQHSSMCNDTTESTPSFVLSPYESLFPSDYPVNERLQLLNEFFSYEFQRVLPRDMTRLLVVPVARHTFIEGFCSYLQTCNSDKDSCSLLMGIVETEAIDANHPAHEAVKEIYRRAFKTLKSLSKLKVKVVVETDEVAKYLSDIAGPWLSIIVMPYVAAYLDEVNTSQRNSNNDHPVVGYVGQSRPERGTLLIPEIARNTLLKFTEPLSWRAQLDMGVIERNTEGEADDALNWLANDPRFEFVETNLSIEAYYELLASIDIMVMPYSARYNETGSGIAAESMRLGHVQVLPRESSMAQIATKHEAGIVTFSEPTIENVSDAVLEALIRFDDLRKQSVQAAKTVRNELSTLSHLERFIQEA